MTYTELYPKLVQYGSLVPMDIPPMQPPYSRWYNQNARCDYNFGNRGHLTEDYTALKQKAHDLIKAGALAFDDEDIPDVNRNPLPDYQRPEINVVNNDLELQIERDVKAVCMPMETAYEALLKIGLLDEEQEKEEKKEDREGQYCLYHKRSVGRSIQDCQHFLELVQEMMDKGVMEFCKEIKGQAVNVLQRKIPKSIIIYYRGRGKQAPTKAPIHPIPKVVIKVPTPFRYANDKAVPWNYTNHVTLQKP